MCLIRLVSACALVAAMATAAAAQPTIEPRATRNVGVLGLRETLDALIELQAGQGLRWAELEKQLQVQEQRLDALNGELATCRREAADKDLLLKQLHDRLADFDKQLSSLGAQSATKEKTVAKLNRELTKLRQEVAARDAHSEGLKDRICSLEADVGSLRGRLTTKDAITNRASRQQSTPGALVAAATFRARRPTNPATAGEDNREKLQRLLAETEAMQSVRAAVAEFRAKNEEVLRAHRAAGAVSGYYQPASRRPVGPGPVWHVAGGRTYRWP